MDVPADQPTPGAPLFVHDVAGEGPVVVLLHGAMDRSTSFARTARHLSGVPVVRYDRRGYGRSLDAGPGDLASHVDDLLTVLRGRPAVLVGHSFGGLIALAATGCAAPGQIAAVGTYEAPALWTDWWPPRLWTGDPAEAAERFLRNRVGAARWERLPGRWRAARRAEGTAMISEVDSIRPGRPPFDAGAVTVPVIVGCGAATSAHHTRAAVELADALPDATTCVIDGAGHDAPATHAAAYAAFVRQVMDRSA